MIGDYFLISYYSFIICLTMFEKFMLSFFLKRSINSGTVLDHSSVFVEFGYKRFPSISIWLIFPFYL